MSTQVQVDERTTVRELVGRHPETRPVFERFDIDYCCGGARSLADAAADRSVDLGDLIDALSTAIETQPTASAPSERDWYAASLSELVEHIVATHHSYVQAALPRLRSLIAKVLGI